MAKREKFLDRWHERAEAFPLIEGDAWDRFKQSIRDSGQKQPITFYIEAGKRIGIDGRQRERACLEEGIKPRYERRKKPDDVGEDIDCLNLFRRHLTSEQRLERVKELRAEGKTQAEIAEKLGVTQATVSGDLKKAAEDGGEKEEKADIVGKDGKAYPAKRKARKAATKDKDEPKEDDADAQNKSIEAYCRSVEELYKQWKDQPIQQKNEWLRDCWDGLRVEIKGLCARVRACKTDNQCPRCKGEGCHSCRNVGRVPHQVYQRLS